MSTPKRIQLKRTKGWCKPALTIVVSRPSIWGNPLSVTDLVAEGFQHRAARQMATTFYRLWLTGELDPVAQHLKARRLHIIAQLFDLHGRDLACWCPLDQPCHADVLLDLANPEGLP